VQLKSRRWFRGAVAAALSLAMALACGARSDLEEGEPEEVVECSEVADCPGDACGRAACEQGVCTTTSVDCDDRDPCTEDTCDQTLGCLHRALAVDVDGDGYFSPRPGFALGDEGACGDDCDDAAVAAHPDAAEICDGRDNDCNGVVDDGARYVASSADAIRISAPEAERAGHGGLIGLEDGFVLTVRERYGSGTAKSRTLLRGLASDGSTRFDTPISKPNVPIDYGPLTWSGEELATAWEDDRESGSYEIYFARFAPDGQKLGPDVRITDAERFSLNPTLIYNRSEYALVWDDRRDERNGEGSRLYGQRVARDGSLLGPNVLVTPDEVGTENPALALGERRMGLVYTSFGDPIRLHFRTLDAELEPIASAAPFGENADSPSVVPITGGFAVVWEIVGPGRRGNELWGTVFDEDAQVVVAPTLLASGASYLRTHATLSLGDRLLVVWADDSAGNYDLHIQTFGRDLSPLGSRSALTANTADSLSPSLAVSAQGTIGVLFDDYREGSRQVYFTTLDCE
jgi:hypothetical protein